MIWSFDTSGGSIGYVLNPPNFFISVPPNLTALTITFDRVMEIALPSATILLEESSDQITSALTVSTHVVLQGKVANITIPSLITNKHYNVQIPPGVFVSQYDVLSWGGTAKPDWNFFVVSIACGPCIAGKYGDGLVCNDCPVGKYSFSDTTQCTQCPLGTYAEDVGESGL